MLYERKDLPELHQMKHRHDTHSDYIKYEDKILTNSLSQYIFNNDMMNSFILYIQPLVAIMIDQMNVVKNFKNYNVDKYYYKHNG